MHTVLSLPAGCFLPYTGVKTNVLFFDRREDGKGTGSVWFYELTNDGFELRQTRRPIGGEQITDFVETFLTRKTGEISWVLSIDEIARRGYDLSARNPTRAPDDIHRPALEILNGIRAREERVLTLLDELESLIGGPT